MTVPAEPSPPSSPPSGPRPPLAPPPPPPKFIRPALGLLAGLGISALVTAAGVLILTLGALRGSTAESFRPSTGYLVANLVVIALGGAAGGFTTSRVTVGRSFFTTFILALILCVSALVPVIREVPPKPGFPDWYSLALAIVVPIGVLLGGVSERRRTVD